MFCATGHFFRGIEGVGSRFQVLRSHTHSRRYQGRRLPFSCFVLPDSFSTVSRASAPVFMFCAPGLIFGGTEGVVSRFEVLRARIHFRHHRGRSVPFSCFALPDTFSAERMASGTIFMFCAPGLFVGGIEGVGYCCHVLRGRTRFRLYRGCRVPFSCFMRPDSFSAVPRASGPIFMFCAPGLVSHGTDGIGSRFQFLRSQTRFRRYRGRRLPFSCFVLPDSFSAVPRASVLVFMF
jgi:hypothetical protein